MVVVADSLCVLECVCVSVCVRAGRSLQAEALGVGDGDGEFVFELLPGSIRRQTDLIEAGVRDRQPAETQRDYQVKLLLLYIYMCQYSFAVFVLVYNPKNIRLDLTAS